MTYINNAYTSNPWLLEPIPAPPVFIPFPGNEPEKPKRNWLKYLFAFCFVIILVAFIVFLVLFILAVSGGLGPIRGRMMSAEVIPNNNGPSLLKEQSSNVLSSLKVNLVEPNKLRLNKLDKLPKLMKHLNR